MNSLLTKSTHAHGAVDFSNVKTRDFLPALNVAIKEANAVIDEIRNETNPTFDNTIVKLELSSEKLDDIQLIFYAYYAAVMTPEVQEISPEFSKVLTQFSNDITLDNNIFKNVKYCYENESVTGEDQKLLDKTFKDFVRAGALLDDGQKDEYRKIEEELSSLGLKFSENSLKSKNEYELILTKKDLGGLPEDAIALYEQSAKEKKKEGYLVTLDYPSFYPLLKNSNIRELRERIAKALVNIATDGEFDNKPVIKRLLELKLKRANLLGYKTHANFVLEERMAQNPQTVAALTDDLFDRAFPKAQGEMNRLISLAKEDGIEEFRSWDRVYYFEKLRQKELDFEQDKLKPYFKLENVIEGVFQVATKLYDLNFKEIDIPVYHEDVQTFEVSRKGEYVGLFYCDFFPRDTKQSGAWMTDFYKQGLAKDGIKRPHVSIVCNFNKPVGDKPSLLTFGQVTTLFHEFGHALHGLLADTKYRSLSGTSVFWDFVELPSQVYENWCYEKECLDLFAKHYETGENIPTEYIEKIKEDQKFFEAFATIRQLKMGHLDMAYHTLESFDLEDVEQFEKDNTEKYKFFDEPSYGCFSCAFGHIFGGGYSAGYYSYKWAEVLDADAFEAFKEKGIFNKDVANAFRENILEKGGSEHPMELYKKFRGREPKVDALLNRAGLK